MFRISPEINWYYYQGANPAPRCIVLHQTITKTPTRWSITSESSVPPLSGIFFSAPPYWPFLNVKNKILGLCLRYLCASYLIPPWPLEKEGILKLVLQPSFFSLIWLGLNKTYEPCSFEIMKVISIVVHQGEVLSQFCKILISWNLAKFVACSLKKFPFLICLYHFGASGHPIIELLGGGAS